MKRHVVIIAVLALATGICASSAFAAAGVDNWYATGAGWVSQPINNVAYTTLETDWMASGQFFGAGPNGLDMMYQTGAGWVTNNLNSIVYTTLSSDIAVAQVMAAGPGNLDVVYATGAGWMTADVNNKTYTSLSPDFVNSTQYDGAGPNGLDINWGGGAGGSHQINANVYTTVASDSGAYDGFAAGVGNLDLVWAGGDGWHTVDQSTDTYVDLATDMINVSNYYGAAADGLYVIWQGARHKINNKVYTSVISDSQYYQAYAAGPDGLDLVFGTGAGWVTIQISSKVYTSLAANAINGQQFYAAYVPEPCSMLALATGLMGLAGIVRRRVR